ncbi:hypothetical protein [Microseira sp. BLCC-F43]|jgi:hypothetical protein|uniref:hypothetical protein n=1 Tax=Microseira sp. BLCC-F43 TaxID=3153602 RepID=UPI0035B77D3A
MIPTQQTYRAKLYPWRIIRHLPNMQRITVARFRRRNEALDRPPGTAAIDTQRESFSDF